ncbi:MAG: tetratricopeptide repeat protein, partial [Candidatus Omnitrophota bacterium]
ITFTIPLMILLYEFSFLGSGKKDQRRRFVGTLPYLAALAIIPLALCRAGEVAMPIKALDYPMSSAEYYLTQLNVFRTYLRLLLFPVRQNIDYDYPVARSFFEGGVLFSCLLLALLLVTAYQAFRKERLLFLGLSWFLLTMGVESGVRLMDAIAEYRLYLPVAGFSIVFTAVLFRGVKRTNAFIVIASCLVLVLSAAAFQRNRVWRDDITLWQDTVRKSPAKARVLNNLGSAYLRQGDLEQAIVYCQKAQKRDPDFPDAYYNLGMAYAHLGDYDRAIRYWEKALELAPQRAEIYRNLGVVYGRKGQPDKETAYYQKAIQISPQYAKAYSDLGFTYYLKGEYHKAAVFYQEALRRWPDDAETYSSLGAVYRKLGDEEKALASYQKAVAMDPGEADAQMGLGLIFLEKKDASGVARQLHILKTLGREDLVQKLELRKGEF